MVRVLGKAELQNLLEKPLGARIVPGGDLHDATFVFFFHQIIVQQQKSLSQLCVCVLCVMHHREYELAVVAVVVPVAKSLDLTFP